MRTSKSPFFLLVPVLFCVCSISLPLSSASATYWGVNGTTHPDPYVTPAYTCVTNYYVAPNGSDSNNGSSSAPWKTITHAIITLNGAAQGGVCVNVAPGTYTESLYLYGLAGSSDSSTGYLVFRSSTLHAATLQAPYANIFSYPNVQIQNSQYLIFDGFNVTGYPYIYLAGTGGFWTQDSHHIKYLNNIVHDVGGSGIGAGNSDYVTVQGNVVYDTSCCESDGTSAIDLYSATAFDSNSGFHNVISSNIVYNNLEGADGRSPHSEGHGIILDNFLLGGYTAATLIENNLVYGNGGCGISTWYTNNVTIRNNTVFDNRRDPLIPYTGGDITAENSSFITGVNNIAVSNPNLNSQNTAIWDQSWIGTNTGNIWANNLTFDGIAGQASVTTFSPPHGAPITTANGNILGSDPLFVNAPAGNFTLQASSPAIGKGTAAYGVPVLDLAGNTRSTSAIDIGAYAFNVIPPR
jgi:parallel beta-helix repeat protein